MRKPTVTASLMPQSQRTTGRRPVVASPTATTTVSRGRSSASASASKTSVSSSNCNTSHSPSRSVSSHRRRNHHHRHPVTASAATSQSGKKPKWMFSWRKLRNCFVPYLSDSTAAPQSMSTTMSVTSRSPLPLATGSSDFVMASDNASIEDFNPEQSEQLQKQKRQHQQEELLYSLSMSPLSSSSTTTVASDVPPPPPPPPPLPPTLLQHTDLPPPLRPSSPVSSSLSPTSPRLRKVQGKMEDEEKKEEYPEDSALSTETRSPRVIHRDEEEGKEAMDYPHSPLAPPPSFPYPPPMLSHSPDGLAISPRPAAVRRMNTESPISPLAKSMFNENRSSWQSTTTAEEIATNPSPNSIIPTESSLFLEPPRPHRVLLRGSSMPIAATTLYPPKTTGRMLPPIPKAPGTSSNTSGGLCSQFSKSQFKPTRNNPKNINSLNSTSTNAAAASTATANACAAVRPRLDSCQTTGCASNLTSSSRHRRAQLSFEFSVQSLQQVMADTSTVYENDNNHRRHHILNADEKGEEERNDDESSQQPSYQHEPKQRQFSEESWTTLPLTSIHLLALQRECSELVTDGIWEADSLIISSDEGAQQEYTTSPLDIIEDEDDDEEDAVVAKEGDSLIPEVDNDTIRSSSISKDVIQSPSPTSVIGDLGLKRSSISSQSADKLPKWMIQWAQAQEPAAQSLADISGDTSLDALASTYLPSGPKPDGCSYSTYLSVSMNHDPSQDEKEDATAIRLVQVIANRLVVDGGKWQLPLGQDTQVLSLALEKDLGHRVVLVRHQKQEWKLRPIRLTHNPINGSFRIASRNRSVGETSSGQPFDDASTLYCKTDSSYGEDEASGERNDFDNAQQCEAVLHIVFLLDSLCRNPPISDDA